MGLYFVIVKLKYFIEGVGVVFISGCGDIGIEGLDYGFGVIFDYFMS